jgi:hypothetical protein
VTAAGNDGAHVHDANQAAAAQAALWAPHRRPVGSGGRAATDFAVGTKRDEKVVDRHTYIQRGEIQRKERTGYTEVLKRTETRARERRMTHE